jgi:cytochrome c-type biogenesis protein CcmH/NrfG
VVLTAVLVVAVVIALATPWAPEPPGGSTPLHLGAVRPGAPLRQAAAAAALADHLRSRPADAVAWATLAWVRRQSNVAEARALAAHALWLDPRHSALRASLRWAEAPAAAEPGSPASTP